MLERSYSRRWRLPVILAGVVMGLALVWAGVLPVDAREGEPKPLFRAHESLKVIIEAPFSKIVGSAEKSTDAHPAILKLVGADGQEQAFNIQLNARGNSRRLKTSCDFPPLKLNFRKGEVKGTLFHGQNKLKLVTHCEKTSKYEQFYRKEYLVYRLYNLLTPISLGVRPLEVTYIDTGGRRATITKFAFVIEDVDDLAKRNGMIEIDVLKVKLSRLEPQAAAEYALFQFMIGNLDWSATQAAPGNNCCHNSKLLGFADRGDGELVPVPYDFDLSGLVNAPYALPPEGLGVRMVTQRVYRGYCRHVAGTAVAVEKFNAVRDEMLALFAGETGLNSGSRRKAEKYLSQFFKIINDDKKLQKIVTGKCLGKKPD